MDSSSEVAWFSSPTMFPDVENKNEDSGELDLTVPTDEELDSFLGQDVDEEIPSSFCPIYDADYGPPAKILKPNNFSQFSSSSGDNRASSTPVILSFDAKENAPEKPRPSAADLKSTQDVKKHGRVRPPSQTYDHIIAERKRREQLGQCFLALSTIVPGLKKLDKSSVLGDAIKYMKFLQEKVKLLEEHATKKSFESVILLKKNNPTPADGNELRVSNSPEERSLPEIEARSHNSQILIKIHCAHHRGILANIIYNVEKLNLRILNTSTTSFARISLHVTLHAEMEKEFNSTVKEVVVRIRAALMKDHISHEEEFC